MKDENTMILGNTKVRILQYLEYKGISKPQFYTDIDIKRGLLDSDKMNATVTDVVIAKILVKYRDIDPLWLLIGEGSMLRTEQRQQASKSEVQPISSIEESSIYKEMYKEKDLEVKDLMETVGSLKEQIRQLKRENERLVSGASDSIHANVG